MNHARNTPAVTRVADLDPAALDALLLRYGIRVQRLADGATIPASHWGAPEAGVIGCTIFARADTPVHSVLHTAAHIICMDQNRRATLHTDCGGDELEEAAVCYLQTLLADMLAGYSREQLWQDMDAWGYSFRLGSAQAWFEQDALDAHCWLQQQSLIDRAGRATGALRR